MKLAMALLFGCGLLCVAGCRRNSDCDPITAYCDAWGDCARRQGIDRLCGLDVQFSADDPIDTSCTAGYVCSTTPSFSDDTFYCLKAKPAGAYCEASRDCATKLCQGGTCKESALVVGDPCTSFLVNSEECTGGSRCAWSAAVCSAECVAVGGYHVTSPTPLPNAH
jgi:hypothetical protein